MKIIKKKTYDEISQIAANIIHGTMTQDKQVNVSLTAGRSPKLTYEYLVPLIKDHSTYKNVQYYLFDETPIKNAQKEVVGTDNYSKINEMLYVPANIPLEQQTNLDENNYKEYDKIIAKNGGLDLIFIGLGEDGHFCANMPECTSFNDETYRVELTNEYPWNEPYQETLGENHSDFMYTIGPKSIMKVDKVLLIVNGKEKAEILKEAIEGPVVETCPASVLQLHPNITILVDEEAAACLSEETIKKYK